jgi:Caspase domain/Domain of unknown function (DUF4384)
MTLPRPESRHVGSLVLAALCAAVAGSTLAADRGLSMTISQYRNAPALPGVVLDRASARAMYQRLGFKGPLRELADAELDLAGMRSALDRLVNDTQPGDRVFLYFSGHGTSSAAAAPSSNGARCEQALLAQDAQPLSGSEIARSLQALNLKAGQVVMVVDACHAGGVAQGAALRGGVPGLAAGYSPKFAAPAGASAADACAQPSNLFASAAPPKRRGAVNLERNFVYLAAAREDEVAFDDAGRGGVATQALLRCLAQPAFTNNPLAAYDDLRDCAQQDVARSLPDDPRFGVQHLVMVGNEALAVHPLVDVLIDPSADVAGAEAPAAALQRAASGADARWRVSAVPTSTSLQIGRDALALSVTSERDGYLYVVHAGSDGRSLDLIYPQRAGDPNALRAGARFDVPRQWRSRGPSGTDRLMVLVAETPQRAGDLLTKLGLGHYAAAACLRNLGSDDCPSTAAGPGVAPAALRFGAALLSVTER